MSKIREPQRASRPLISFTLFIVHIVNSSYLLSPRPGLVVSNNIPSSPHGNTIARFLPPRFFSNVLLFYSELEATTTSIREFLGVNARDVSGHGTSRSALMIIVLLQWYYLVGRVEIVLLP